MKNFIKLTTKTGKPVYINVNFIGDFSDILVKEHGENIKYTNIGVLTHNNGGFTVKETVEEIVALIENS